MEVEVPLRDVKNRNKERRILIVFIMLFLLAFPIAFAIWIIWLIWKKDMGLKAKILLTASVVLMMAFPLIIESATKQQWSTIVFAVVTGLVTIALIIVLWVKETWGEAIKLKPSVKASLTFPLVAILVLLIVLVNYTLRD